MKVQEMVLEKAQEQAKDLVIGGEFASMLRTTPWTTDTLPRSTQKKCMRRGQHTDTQTDTWTLRRLDRSGPVG